MNSTTAIPLTPQRARGGFSPWPSPAVQVRRSTTVAGTIVFWMSIAIGIVLEGLIAHAGSSS